MRPLPPQKKLLKTENSEMTGPNYQLSFYNLPQYNH